MSAFLYGRVAGTKVKLLWTVYAHSVPDARNNALSVYFPGAKQVDLVGADAYNFGNARYEAVSGRLAGSSEGVAPATDWVRPPMRSTWPGKIQCGLVTSGLSAQILGQRQGSRK